MNSWASDETEDQYLSSKVKAPLFIWAYMSETPFASSKGGYPPSNIKTITPQDHMSTSRPYGFSRMISGATYAGVPHKSLSGFLHLREQPQTRKRNHPRHRVLDTSRVDGVKAPRDAASALGREPKIRQLDVVVVMGGL